MDIYTMIHNDHEDARKLVEEINLLPVAHSASRFAIFTVLRDIVLTHNDAEAGSFYIALEGHPATNMLAAQSRKEHEEARKLLQDLSNASLPAAKWEQKFAEFCKALLHHMDEEEGKVFDAARQVILAPMTEELAKIMERQKLRKQELLRKSA